MRLLVVLALVLSFAAPAQAAVPRGWAPTGSMSVPRGFAGGVLPDDGRFLIAGGDDGTTTFASAVIYDPATGTWAGRAAAERDRVRARGGVGSDRSRPERRRRPHRLNRKRLTNRAKVTITVSKAGRLTTTVVDRVSRGRRIEGRPRCVPVGC